MSTLKTLKELELYDNQITVIENLNALVNLEYVTLFAHYKFYRYFFRILDLSFNRIKKIEGLSKLKKLEKLYLSSNKITVIENLDDLPNLTLLELGDNKIRVSIYIFYLIIMTIIYSSRLLKIWRS